MKRLHSIIFFFVFIISCSEIKKGSLRYDSHGVNIKETVSITKGDKYYQSVYKPTRGVTATVTITNTSDTTRKFEVLILEIK